MNKPREFGLFDDGPAQVWDDWEGLQRYRDMIKGEIVHVREITAQDQTRDDALRDAAEFFKKAASETRYIDHIGLHVKACAENWLKKYGSVPEGVNNEQI